ncbi:unnamed protein product, partial [Ectocarpus sp. 12 AP-2014]
ELREFVDGEPPQPPPAAGARGREGRRGGGGRAGSAAAAAAERATAAAGPGLEAAACDAILRGQVAQLRRQVRLQWCAVDASSAVTQEVKAVLGHLEDTLLELASLGQDGSSSSGPRSPGGVSSRQRSGNPKGPGGGGGTKAIFYPAVTAGGVFGDAALPAWRQVLDRVKDLSR